MTNIDVCICTFRRLSLADTLISIGRLELAPEWKLRVIIADNDETPSAQALVESTARENNLNVTYVHAPARNISIARNACLDAATAPYLAFVDDDEIVTPGWMKALMAKMEGGTADVVLGPVKAIYRADSPAWISAGNYHSTVPVFGDGKMVAGCSTGNAFLRREAPAIAQQRFRGEFGKSGGEDTLYFSAIHRAGGRIEYAPDALVTEMVPKNRATLIWLLKRKFRSGQTHGVILRETNRGGLSGYIKNLLLAGSKMSFCGLCALVNLPRPDRMRYWMLRGALHAGVVSHLLGKDKIVQYGGETS